MKESWRSIKCPYCFKEFAHDEVHFRIAEEACKDAEKKADEEIDSDKKQRFLKFIKREELDPKFDTVWGDLRGGIPASNVENLFLIPWVDQSNKSVMIVGDYIPDQDGFIEKIEDKCSHFESKTRICPYCHNKLPLHYGKNPQKFISILGVSASGKTVFLKQILAKLKDSLQGGILNHVNGSFVELTLPDDDNTYLTLDQPLPDSTKTLNFKVPYFVTMTFKKDDVLTTYDFVIYDVAGEILVDFAKNDPNKFDFFAGYIKSSDAIITLIDPIQLVDNPRPQYPANEMISTLYKVFGGPVKVPTAITISKSDLLLTSKLIRESLNPDGTFFNENSIITKNIPWDPAKKYFYADEYANLSGQLRRFYVSKANPFYESVKHNLMNHSFFAVSALFDGVDQKLTFALETKDRWESKNIEKYIKKFPILKKKLEDIRLDLEEQEENPEENIIDANSITVSRSFIFDQSDEVARRLDEILGNVSTLNTRADIREAVYDQFCEDEKIELVAANRRGDETLSMNDLIKYISCLNEDMADCKFDIFMQGYPRSNGNLKSLRIEEPFFWLLSEMDIIGRGNVYTSNLSKGKNGKGSKVGGHGFKWVPPFGGRR